MVSLTLTAPAKLNVSLEILGERQDGYHELRTLMVRLPDLNDHLSFTPADHFSFTCNDTSLPTGEENLVVKAVRAFENEISKKCQFHLHLEKMIPHGAGLGGGSSDAAAALIGLNRLHGNLLSIDILERLSAGFGSDIPFFITNGPSWCTGRGEIITNAKNIPSLPVLLLKPSFGVSTQDAYGRFKDGTFLPGISYDPQSIAGVKFLNDLERPVFSKHRFLAEVKQWLSCQPGVKAALMSGSGSTMFAVLEDLSLASTLAKAVKVELDPRLWTWSGVTESSD